MAPKKPKYIQVWAGPGRFSFPYLSAPCTTGQYPDDKYKTDLIITKATFKDKNSELQQTVLEVGRDAFGSSFKLTSKSPLSPFKDTDKDEKITNEAMKGCIVIRAKNKKPPYIIGPAKVNGAFPELSEKQVSDIKGGDWGKLLVSVFSYEQQGGGVSFGLDTVQFWKQGEAFGQGRSRMLESAEELETDLEDADEDVKSSKGSKQVEEEEDDEDVFS